MSAITFLRWSFAIPLVVAVIAIAFALLNRFLGLTQITIGRGWAVIFAYSGYALLVGVLPYCVFLVAAHFWSRGKSPRAVLAFALVAPVWFAMLFFVLWVSVTLTLNTAYALDGALESGGVYAAVCLVLGYAYVAFALGIYYTLRWLGKVESIANKTTA